MLCQRQQFIKKNKRQREAGSVTENKQKVEASWQTRVVGIRFPKASGQRSRSSRLGPARPGKLKANCEGAHKSRLAGGWVSMWVGGGGGWMPDGWWGNGGAVSLWLLHRQKAAEQKSGQPQ